MKYPVKQTSLLISIQILRICCVRLWKKFVSMRNKHPTFDFEGALAFLTPKQPLMKNYEENKKTLSFVISLV